MKILDAGDHPLSNADVLDWIQRKRAQHASEDAADKASNLPAATRPKNFLTALNRVERELTSPNYPYSANPSVYSSENRIESFRSFALEAENVIQDHLEEEWAERLKTMDAEEVEKEFGKVQEMKCLTEPEMLMVFNYAPTCVEMLQPMIENVEERFSAEEQQMLVDVVLRTLRKDENKVG